MDAMTPQAMLADNQLLQSNPQVTVPPKSPQAMLAAIPPDVKPITHDVTIVTTRKLAQAKCMGVPPEEFGIERGARNIRDCNYCFHEVVTKTEGQLIAEGFDEQQIKALTVYTGTNNEIETIARDTVREHYSTEQLNSAARPVKITEHYIRMDYDGKGKPCLYQVITGGDQGEILNKDDKPCIEPYDAIPFACITPVPVTHRFFGRSIADQVMDIQRVKTALVRGMLDNLYLHNNPRVEVAEANAGPNTLDDLLVSRPGGVVRTKTAGGLNWQVVPDITASIYPALQYMDATREMRTGMSNQSQGIDADALQNQSATAVAQVFSASQMRMKLIARIVAEGVKDMFALLHGTIRRHGQQAQTVRLRNTWVEVDPRNWKTRNDMTIHVGLGTGGKAQQFAQVMALGNFQKELLLGGKANLVDDQALHSTGTELCKIMGFKNPDKFINDPSAKDPQTGQLLHPPVPAPPDPKVQIEQIKAQNEQVALGHKAQLEQQQAQNKAQLDASQAQVDAFHQKVKLEGEVQLAREKHDLDMKLKLVEAALKEKADLRAHELHQQQLAHAEQLHQHTMAQGAQAHASKLREAEFGLAANAQSHEAKLKETKAKTAAKAEKPAPAPKPAAPAAPAKNPVADVVTILDALGKAQKPKKVVRDKDGQITGLE